MNRIFLFFFKGILHFNHIHVFVTNFVSYQLFFYKVILHFNYIHVFVTNFVSYQ